MTVEQGIYRKRLVWASSGLIATVVVFAGAATFLHPVSRPSGDGSIASLVKASSSDARSLEPRLSGGFAWAPFRPARRGGSKADPIFASALGATLAKVRDVPAPAARHAEGVAELLAGHSAKALSTLTAAAEQSSDPAVWNDLAVVFHETALRENAPELLADALVACDRALSQRPQFPEALFNRAIVIERLGLRDDAREAWERYLVTDSTSGWATEARTHFHALAPEVPFLARLDRAYDRVRNDPAAATALVHSDPSGARGIGALESLGRWGKAVLRHDDRDADRHLGVARQLGAAVALVEGDQMLKEAVATIDAASGATRAILAAAHADYLDGLMTFNEQRPVEAEPLLRRAVAGFEKARSPEVLQARYFTANTLYAQGHHDAAEREVERLIATASPDFPATRALMLETLGASHSSRADWGAAITYLEQSESLFDRLGDMPHGSSVRRRLAFVYDRIGDPGTAWKYRLVALRGLGERSNADLEQGVASITDSATLRHEWPKALAFLNIEIRIAHRIHDDLQLGAKPLIRAVVRDRLNDQAGARSDIADAKDAIARIKDSSDRAYLNVAALRASAMLSSTPPAQADALLSEAIEYQATQSDPLKLPGLLLERARARRKTGNVTGAMSDIQQGIAELEQHRQSLPAGEARWGAFHAAEELFDEGVSLAMAAGDAEAAFRFAERSRARSLLDSYGRSSVLDYKQLPAGTVVVEYIALPAQLIIFTADASGVRAAAVECGREKLIAETDALAEAIRKAQSIPASNQSAALYRRLIEPVATQLLSARTVVFVPDGATSIVPFSALTDARGVYLIQQHVIVVAPSAAAFAAAAARKGESAVPGSALVLSASEPGAGGAALEYVDAEARHVANAYRRATRLTDNDAELDELIKRAPHADVIHFAGHAIGDDRGIEPASILLRQNGRQRRVGVAEIAKLRLRHRCVVVLAGCSTGRGERRASEGVISVAHGFLSAGAPSVIATLWQIDDQAASIFYPRLHARLAAGLSAAEALREAQLESIRRGDVPASLWAAVQNIGS